MCKPIQALTIILLVVFTFADDFDPNYSYDDFLRHFDKKYTEEERPAHQAAFIKNYAKLLQLKNEGKDVKINERLDWTDQETNDFLSYRPQNSGIPASARPLKNDALFASPPQFDWRTYGIVTPIKNQGNCGSCWAFSSTAEYQSKIAISTNGTLYDLAQQYLLKCQTTYSLGCNGGYPYRALQYIQTTGIPLQSTYPYNPSTTYPNICTNTTNRIKLNQTINNITFYLYQNLTIEQLQQDLVNYGPINVGVYASDFNFGYVGSSGLISCSEFNDRYQIDHAILLVGYNSSYWFVKNSWGTTWGDNGFGYISKNTSNDCNIRQYVNQMQITTISPNPPTPPDPTLLNLTITMTDSYADGWQGNIIAIKQNGSIVGTFGNSFTSGSSSGPVYIAVKGDIQVQVVVGTIGNSMSQIGFVIKAPNNTVLYQRSNGASFPAGMVFKTFCINGGCTATDYITLIATMTDSYGDGWNLNTLGLRQNSLPIAYLGTQFTTGNETTPTQIYLDSTKRTQLYVHQYGTKTQQIAFILKYPNGTIIYQRTSGTVFNFSTIFVSFCPIQGCYSTLVVSVQMSDSYGDGWEGNVIGFKQDGVIVGIFGEGFSLGYSSTVSVTLRGDIETEIVVKTLGSSTSEIGFTIKAPNNTIIHRRTPGTSFNTGTIFSKFCPISGCPVHQNFTLSITLNDNFGDGWNNNIIGIRQNGAIVATFGTDFKSGKSYGPFYVGIQGSVQAQIVVVGFGCCTNQIGFVVKASNGTVIYRRSPGRTYTSTTIFSTFCPAGGCLKNPNITYYLTLSDVYGDGWEGTVLAFKQNGTVKYKFGLQSGYNNTPTPYTFTKYATISITVFTLGQYTNEIGFILRNDANTIVFERIPGQKFFYNSLLGSFCVQCINYTPAKIIDSDKSKKSTTPTITDPDTENPEQEVINQNGRGYMIATYTLISLLCISIIGVAILSFKLIKAQTELKQLKQKQPSPNPNPNPNPNLKQPKQQNKVNITEHSMNVNENDQSYSPEKQHISTYLPE